MVNCEQIWLEISNYVEGDIDPALRVAMDEHFRTCQRCKSVLEGTRNVIRLYGDERMIEVPSGFGRRLEKHLARNSRVSTTQWNSWSAWIVPVAALFLFVGGLRLANSLSATHPLKSEHAQQAHDIPPDMPVIVTAGAKVFHASGCPFIHNKTTERTLTAKEAMQEGYVPCLRCMRKYLNTASSGRTVIDDDADSDADDHEVHSHGGDRLQGQARSSEP